MSVEGVCFRQKKLTYNDNSDMIMYPGGIIFAANGIEAVNYGILYVSCQLPVIIESIL